MSCDMRDWNAPEKADILVSELLGSFGDNELSPECLDGAQKFLKGRVSRDILHHNSFMYDCLSCLIVGWGRVQLWPLMYQYLTFTK